MAYEDHDDDNEVKCVHVTVLQVEETKKNLTSKWRAVNKGCIFMQFTCLPTWLHVHQNSFSFKKNFFAK